MEGTAAISKSQKNERSWRGFQLGPWSTSIDVRDFIVRNATPYSGDEKFLVGPSKRTQAVWDKLQPYFRDEQKKGVLAVDAQTPSWCDCSRDWFSRWGLFSLSSVERNYSSAII